MRKLTLSRHSWQLSRFKGLAREGIWIILGQIASVLGSVVLVRVLTDRLNPNQYGQLALGLTIAGLFNQVAVGGIASAIGRFYSIACEKKDLGGYLRASNLLIVYSILGAIIIALALMAGLAINGYNQWTGLVAVILIFTILSGYNSALNNIQNAARQRSVVALHGGLDSLLKIFFSLYLLKSIGSSSTVVVMSFAAASLVTTASQLFFLRHLVSQQVFTVEDSRTIDWVRQMWTFSWPMVAGGLFNWGFYASQRWALDLFISTEEVGKFYALTQVAYAPVSAGGSLIMSLLLPILYARAPDPHNVRRISEIRHYVLRVVIVGVGLTFLCSCVATLFHNEIFAALVSQQYRSISIYMPLVVIAAGLLQSSIALAGILQVANKTKSILPIATLGNLIIILTNFLCAYRLGLVGLLISMVLGSVLHLSWMLYTVLTTKFSQFPR